MSELKTEFKYDLEQSFEYASNGETKNATFLIVKMPTGRLAEHTAVIDQEFQKAAAYIENNYSNITNSDNKETKEDDSDSYKSISKILAAGNSDLNKCYSALRNLLTATIGNFAFCKIDDEVKFGTSNFDMMSIKDINNILGRYIESFL